MIRVINYSGVPVYFNESEIVLIEEHSEWLNMWVRGCPLAITVPIAMLEDMTESMKKAKWIRHAK